MAPRLQLEKAAWRWVESVKPEDIQQEHIDLAYRVHLPACVRGTCRYRVMSITLELGVGLQVCNVNGVIARPVRC